MFGKGGRETAGATTLVLAITSLRRAAREERATPPQLCSACSSAGVARACLERGLLRGRPSPVFSKRQSAAIQGNVQASRNSDRKCTTYRDVMDSSCTYDRLRVPLTINAAAQREIHTFVSIKLPPSGHKFNFGGAICRCFWRMSKLSEYRVGSRLRITGMLSSGKRSSLDGQNFRSYLIDGDRLFSTYRIERLTVHVTNW